VTKYKFENGDIMSGYENVGWLSDNINHLFECVSNVKKTIESHGHTLDVKYFRRGVEVVCTDAYIRTTSKGIYITGEEDEMNYAIFSNELNCAKSCAKSVLEVMSA